MSKRIRVLYAPTWEGFYEDSCYSSVFKLGMKIVDFFLANSDRFEFEFKHHPLTGSGNPEFGVALEAMQHRLQAAGIPDASQSGKDLYDYFRETDILIADISSVVSDFMFLNRPIIVCNPLEFEDMPSQFPVTEGCYILNPADFRLQNILGDIAGSDSIKRAREKVREDILGPVEFNALAAFNDSIADFIVEKIPAVPEAELAAMELNEVLSRVFNSEEKTSASVESLSCEQKLSSSTKKFRIRLRAS